MKLLDIYDIIAIDETTTLIVEGFLPDFIIEEDGSVTTQSQQFNNPGIKVKIISDGEVTFDKWLFQLFPDIHPFTNTRYHIMYTDTLMEDGTSEIEGEITESSIEQRCAVASL